MEDFWLFISFVEKGFIISSECIAYVNFNSILNSRFFTINSPVVTSPQFEINSTNTKIIRNWNLIDLSPVFLRIGLSSWNVGRLYAKRIWLEFSESDFRKFFDQNNTPFDLATQQVVSITEVLPILLNHLQVSISVFGNISSYNSYLLLCKSWLDSLLKEFFLNNRVWILF